VSNASCFSSWAMTRRQGRGIEAYRSDRSRAVRHGLRGRWRVYTAAGVTYLHSPVTAEQAREALVGSDNPSPDERRLRDQ
jgi:hypothetical protein